MSVTAGAESPAPASGRASVFSRPASGLIRVAGSTDVFIYNIGLVSIGIAIALNQYYGPALYPGAAPWLSTILAAAGMCFAATTFYFWAVTFPRSGGVYVLLSRATNPAVAFVLSVVETIILLYYAAYAASLIATVGLSSSFATIGAVTENDTLLKWAGSTVKPTGIFWIGTAMLVTAGVLMALGTRRYFTVQRVLFGAAVLGTVITAIVMLFGSHDSFIGNLKALAGLDYDEVLAKAREAGYEPQSFSFGKTAEFLIWPLLPLLGAIQSVGLGGEIKRIRRAQLFGMLGAVAVAAFAIAAFGGLANKAFGSEFQGAISFNSLSGVTDGSTEGALSVAPWFTVLAGILTDNVILAGIIMLTFIAWIWFWIPAEIAYTTRTMVAWSFDRIAPDRLGTVSRRFHTPVVAIALSTAGAIVFMWLIAFRAIALLSLVEALLVVWGTAMAAAVVFPWVRKDFYASSPVRGWKVFGLPAMAVTGAVSVLFFLAAFVLLWRDELAAGPLIDTGATSFWILVGAVVTAAVWYVGMKRYRASRGVDVDLAFRQIPIE